MHKMKNNFLRKSFVLSWMGLFIIISSLKAQPLKLMSLNVRYDNPSDGKNAWIYRKEAIAHWIGDSIQPDVVCLQEVLHHQLEYLQEQWKERYDHFGVGREDGKMKGEYSPIFYDKSRFEFIKGETLWLSDTPQIPSKGWDAACERIVTALYLKDKKLQDTLCVFNTHWDHVGSVARLKSADVLLRLYASLPAHYSFFCAGDFNAQDHEESIEKLLEHWRDLSSVNPIQQPTFTGFQDQIPDAKRIDYLWARKRDERKCLFHQVRGAHGVSFLSDHDVIWVEIR